MSHVEIILGFAKCFKCGCLYECVCVFKCMCACACTCVFVCVHVLKVCISILRVREFAWVNLYVDSTHIRLMPLKLTLTSRNEEKPQLCEARFA